MTGPRDAARRKADTLVMLEARVADIWVATAGPGPDGTPGAHLVPLSLAWIGERIVVALAAGSVTARNLAGRPDAAARLALGPTRDVVMIDAVLERAIAQADVPAELAQRYADQAGWDPRRAGDDQLYLILRPERIQAWREADELPGRTLMQGGAWLV